VSSIVNDRAASERGALGLCSWCGAPAPAGVDGLSRCPACGAATTSPWPDEDELERAYGDWYRPTAGRFSGGGDRLLTFSRARLARRLSRIAPPGPVLDVGAGDGTLIRAVQARGREAVGLERAATSEEVLECEITAFADRPGQWAAVVFWHSLEHLRDPSGALDRAAELLQPEGILAVAVPNLSSWQARAFGRDWFHLDLPRHLVHLPVSTLAQGIRARGFEIRRCSHWRAGQILFGWLYGLVGALPGHPDLYSAIRRTGAQGNETSGGRRAAVLAAGVVVAPVAAALAVAEIIAGAGGTVYTEARRL
jgi:SAM-dependent methyltransferase